VDEEQEKRRIEKKKGHLYTNGATNIDESGIEEFFLD